MGKKEKKQKLRCGSFIIILYSKTFLFLLRAFKIKILHINISITHSFTIITQTEKKLTEKELKKKMKNCNKT